MSYIAMKVEHFEQKFLQGSYDSRSDECDIGFSSKTYFRIHQFGIEFLLNHVSFKRKQEHPQRANRKGKKPFRSKLSVSIASEAESRKN